MPVTIIHPQAPPFGARAVFALFADFDGTLVPLAERPEQVQVAAGLPRRLAAVRARLGGALAIVTGRPISAVDSFLAPQRFAIAGAHGAERRRADGTLLDAGPDLLAASHRIGARLTEFAASDARLALEIKAGAVALHFRQAPELEDACRIAVTAAIAEEPAFTVTAGKMVFEVRPATINKGLATRDFMAEAPFAGRLPVFIGDDLTDEDGFAMVQQQGGVGIKVGAGETRAQLRLPDVNAVHRLLEAFGDAGRIASIGDIAALTSVKEA